MQKLLMILMLVFLNGCCTVTSQDCGGCNFSAPELSEEAKAWITPFEDGEYLIFESNNGNIDSLQIERIVDTEFFGGDECGDDGDVERAIVESIQNTNLKMIIEATMGNVVALNYNEEEENYILVELNVMNNNIGVANDNASGIINDDFTWNGETISVVEIFCEDAQDCFEYEMRKIIISRELGLLEYIDKNGANWKRIN